MTDSRYTRLLNIPRLILIMLGVYYCFLIPIVQIILLQAVGGETAGSVGVSLMMFRPVSIFLDDAHYSTQKRMLEYLWFSGGIIPFCATICFTLIGAKLSKYWRSLIYTSILLTGFGLTLVYKWEGDFYVVLSLAVLSGIATGGWIDERIRACWSQP
jgi:hypothetical protein